MNWIAMTFLAAACGAQPPMSRGYSIPTLDLSGQTPQVVVDRETGQYLGHPTTVLLEDGRTVLAVYPKGHGRGAIVLKRSVDGGRTWSERLPTPLSWKTSLETPTVHRVVDAAGKRRLILWSGLYPARLSVSEDDGATWSELNKAGDWGGIVVMGFVEPVRDQPGCYLAMFHDDGRFFSSPPHAKSPIEFTLYRTWSRDGGLTWSFPEAVFASSAIHLCEPGCVRSPDGKQLAVLLRENSRRRNAYVIFSDDEGQTWTPPRELPAALTGDRHTGKYAPDGRLLISFRDTTHESPTRGDWVAWVGTYDDLAQGREGQYRVRLMDNQRNADCAYPGVECLPDGTMLATTYGHWVRGQPPFIVSVRFKLEELDRLAAEDAARLSWRDLPAARDGLGWGGPIVGVHQNALILAGGANFPGQPPWQDGGKVWYDAAYVLTSPHGAWRKMDAKLPRPRAYAACVSLPQGVVVIGGGDSRGPTSDVLRLTWNAPQASLDIASLPPLPEPSMYHAATHIGGTVYVLAGQRTNDPLSLQHEFWSLDLEQPAQQQVWRGLPPLPGGPRLKCVLVAQQGADGAPRVFAFSGEVPTAEEDGQVHRRYLTDAYAFDPRADQGRGAWTTLGRGPPQPVAAGATLAVGVHSILVFSGSTGEHIGRLPLQDHPPFPRRVLRYDTRRQQWEEAGEMLQGVVTTTAVRWGADLVVPSGEVRPGVRTARVQAARLQP